MTSSTIALQAPEKATHLSQDDQLIPRQVQLLDGLAENDLGLSVGVCLRQVSALYHQSDGEHAHVCCIECRDTVIVSTTTREQQELRP